MDAGRALMNFAVPQPLGKDGLNWLKIHLINLHGLKKKYEMILLYFHFSSSHLV